MTQRELDQGQAGLATPAADGAAAPAQAPAPAATAAVSLPAGSTRDRYNYAYGLLRQARYDEAEEAFEQFLTAHPGDPLAQNAQYWLGKVYFVREEYVLAAKTFTENYKAYPEGPKAPDSLLNLGLSLSRLDKKAAACAAFDELKRKFPKVSPRIARTVKSEWDANGCR
ncbi:MAG: tol-pal system protein YbgF [Hyphomicrobiales bacterium]|nr:tol-pal system protein YbgF [Hyphomicrobiales bacterium]